MGNAIDKLTTDTALIDALRAASGKGATAEELLEQRVSFVFGSIDADSAVTRSQIRKALVDHEGGSGVRK